MRLLGILLIFASFPVFLSALRSGSGRRLAFIALGALPILHSAMNLDAAIISWSTWPGHTKGMLLTPLDPLSLAICMRYAREVHRPPLLWVLIFYPLSMIPGLLSGSLFQPAFFYIFQSVRIILFFYAVYLVVSIGEIKRLGQGLALAVILNAIFALKGALSGAAQSAGLLSHQNLSGVAVNLGVPVLLALGLQKKGGWYLAAAAAGGVSALAGGSRATIVFYAAAIALTLFGSALVRPTSRKIAIASLGLVALLFAFPLGFHKVTERGGLFKEDLERVAFERAAEMMIEDRPWGVGINQYVTVANAQGYLSRAGVRWGRGARATNVHNTYLLTRVEGGVIALLGFLLLLLVPLIAALRVIFRKEAPLREVSIGVAVALSITALHSRYEWVIVTIVPQYLIAMMVGIVAALMAASRSSGGRASSNTIPSDHRDRNTSGARVSNGEISERGDLLNIK